MNTGGNFSYLIKPSKLVGKVKISGAKNSALRLLAASLLTDEKVTINNFPKELLDIQVHLEMLEVLGKEYSLENSSITILEKKKLKTQLNWEKRSIRNTLLILGALVARYGSGSVPLPGGCNLGDRKYDIHKMLLEKMGAKVWEENGYLMAESNGKLIGADIHLPIRSTGATENGILCGCLALGKTRIWNPHIRPEILDLVVFLNKMGAKISVYGQECIEIKGVEFLKGTEHNVIPDNMEAITWFIGSVITNGDVEIEDFPFHHLEVPLIFLRESGAKYEKRENSIVVRGGKCYPVEISTGPYPGINSDMQPLFAIYGACAKGVSKIVDLRFIGRYQYSNEFIKMGIRCKTENNILIIEGGKPLIGSEVSATDIRAGISLLLAGLVAKGETILLNAWQVERGYENLMLKMQTLNANAICIE